MVQGADSVPFVYMNIRSAKMTGNFEIRFAQPQDVPMILHFINQLAQYENMSDQVVATQELLHEWIFVQKKAEVLFAEEAGKPIGFALFFHN